MNEAACDIVLIGGGHSHVAVLADWAKRGCPAKRAVLLTPHPSLRYSGMVPGWIAGQHDKDAGLVDLAGLAKAAGAELVLDRCVAFDPVTRNVLTLENGLIPFGLASIDVGGVGRAAKILGADPRLSDVRPIDGFVEALSGADLADEKVVVVGGGAGGVELAFALRNRARNWGRNREGSDPNSTVTLIAGEKGLLPGFSKNVRHLVETEFERQGIAVLPVDAWIERGVLTAGEVEVEANRIVAAVGSGAPDWPRSGGLAVDADGFIEVDAHQRSTSHPHVFAAGDCARRTDTRVDHAGVHAVHAGPVLAANLRAALTGREPTKTYTPRPASLYLLSTGNGEAILSYGHWAAQGRWVARFKSWIDKGWIAKYAALSKRA